MIDRELSELRRRFRPDRAAITRIYGCYVSAGGEILAEFEESMAMLPVPMQEKYLDLLRKSISGSLGKTLSALSFSTEQVAHGAEHRLLSQLLQERLSGAEARHALFARIAGALRLPETGYLIVLASDVYDVPFRGKDGALRDDSGDSQFCYYVCGVCPVKETQPALRYEPAEKRFQGHGADWVVGNPELGFLFPAFENRGADLYGALLYKRSKQQDYGDFVEAVFRTKPPMAVSAQAETFRDVLVEALDEECSPKVVQAVHTQLRELAAVHKEARDPEPLTVRSGELGEMIARTGVSEPHAAAFRVKYESAFGTDAAMPPQNLLNTGQLEYKTPDVTIRLNPDRQDLIEIRSIGGRRCIVVTAEEGIEINGVSVV